MLKLDTPTNTNKELTIYSYFNNAWIPLPTLIAYLNQGKSWVYDKIAANEFPAPKKFGRSSRWSVKDIIQWEIDNGYRDPEDKPC